jgi:hypothetical protein
MNRALSFALCCTLLLAVGCGERLETDNDAADLQPQVTPGGGDLPPVSIDAGEPPEAEDVEVTLTEWSITLSRDSVPAGPVTFNISNGGTVPHAFRILRGAEEWAIDPYDPGQSVSMSIVLTPGTYEVHCPVTANGMSHAQRGMQTRLRVY